MLTRQQRQNLQLLWRASRVDRGGWSKNNMFIIPPQKTHGSRGWASSSLLCVHAFYTQTRCTHFNKQQAGGAAQTCRSGHHSVQSATTEQRLWVVDFWCAAVLPLFFALARQALCVYRAGLQSATRSRLLRVIGVGAAEPGPRWHGSKGRPLSWLVHFPRWVLS